MAGGNVLQLATADEALARLDELEHRLRVMTSELASLQRLSMMGVLAGGIAHEINNLLTPVLSYSQLALAKPDDEELRTKALERTCASIESISQIVHAILGMSRGEDENTISNIADCFDETLHCLARDPSKDGITIENMIEPDAWVALNPVVMQQVFLNLIINAMKAMKGRRGTIAVSTKQLHDGRTRITVSDDGPGVPPEILPTIFESPSETPSKSRKRRQAVQPDDEGSGLGLSICRQLIENASGTIACTSSPSKGATFTIMLPSAPNIARKAG